MICFLCRHLKIITTSFVLAIVVSIFVLSIVGILGTKFKLAGAFLLPGAIVLFLEALVDSITRKPNEYYC